MRKKNLLINPFSFSGPFLDEEGNEIGDVYIKSVDERNYAYNKINYTFNYQITHEKPAPDKESITKVDFTIKGTLTEDEWTSRPTRLRNKFSKGDRVRVLKWARWNPININNGVDSGYVLTVSSIKSLGADITYSFLPSDNSLLSVEEIFNENCLRSVGDSNLEVVKIQSEAEAEASDRLFGELLDDDEED